MKLEQLLRERDIEELADEELIMAHVELHGYYREIRHGREVEDWEMEPLIEVHDEIRDEMEARDLPHNRIDALDKESAVEQMEPELVPTEYHWTPAHVSFMIDVARGVSTGLIDPMRFQLNQDDGGLTILPDEGQEELSDEQVAFVESLVPVEVAGMTAPAHQVVDMEEMA